MIQMGKKYPLFVLPLARDVIGDVPEGLAKEGGAVEMHLLVSSFLVLSHSSIMMLILNGSILGMGIPTTTFNFIRTRSITLNSPLHSFSRISS